MLIFLSYHNDQKIYNSLIEGENSMKNNGYFIIKTKDGEVRSQDAAINIFVKSPEKKIAYKIVAEYPHDPKNFVQGFQMEGNTIYESEGQYRTSRILKYTLGEILPIACTAQPTGIFSEGITIVGDKVYQLTWKNKKGFVFDKKSLHLLSEFAYPKVLKQGWGLTYDGKNLVASDGSENLYFLEVSNPSNIEKIVAVTGGNTRIYDQLNELEYHQGFIYANIWHKSMILKINPANGEVIGILDFTDIAKKNTKGSNDVLNGIAFKGENMLITGKNWSKIYEVVIQ